MKRFFLMIIFTLFFGGMLPALNVQAETNENYVISYDEAGNQPIEGSVYTGEKIWFAFNKEKVLNGISGGTLIIYDTNLTLKDSDDTVLVNKDGNAPVAYIFDEEGKYQYKWTIKIKVGFLQRTYTYTGEIVVYNPQPESTSPQSQSVKSGGIVTFEIDATGKDVKYDWRKAETETEAGVSIGETKSWIRVTAEPSAAGYYYCVLKNDYGIYTTERAKLTILCPVKYHANGGKGAPAEYLAEYNESIKVSGVVPKREGYIFKGWSTSKTANNALYISGDYYCVKKAVTLYAVWEEKPLKQQNITSITSKKVTYGTKSFSLKAKTSGNGKLTYATSNKKVATVSSGGKITIKGYGKATITIIAAKTSKYKKATRKITVTVVPKKMFWDYVKSTKKGYIKFDWNKNSTVSGYECQVSLSSKFSTNKKYQTRKKECSKNVKVPFEIKGFKSKKTYYVRVRSYKTVNGTKYYGAWSAVKKVKVK